MGSRLVVERVMNGLPSLCLSITRQTKIPAFVGTVDYSDFPPAAKHIVRIGSYENPDVEAIVALKPDLVIRWQSGNSPRDLEPLKRLGVPLVRARAMFIAPRVNDVVRKPRGREPRGPLFYKGRRSRCMTVFGNP
jgi:ABC-type hemin transport system substrate-binding protein